MVKFRAFKFAYRPYKGENLYILNFHKLFQDGGSVILYGPYKHICGSIKFLYFALNYL